MSSIWIVVVWVGVPLVSAAALVLVTRRNAARRPPRSVAVVEIDAAGTADAVHVAIAKARRVTGDAVLLIVIGEDVEPSEEVVQTLQELFEAGAEHALALVAPAGARQILRPRGLPLFASREEAAAWLVST